MFNHNSVVNRDRISRSPFSFRWGIALGVLTLLLPACAVNSRQATAPPDRATLGSGSTLGDVADDTDELIGQMVTVDGKVGEVVDRDTFNLQQDQFLGGDEVLIVNANPNVPIVAGNWVRVTGKVRQFVRSEFETDYDLDWNLDLDKKLEAQYEKQPAIIAESVELLAVD
ncbi:MULTISPECIES: hypothetical protein [unclassified Coleofasciculus]|uniref:hypothetical protein n=1 Tax=unclassified Coleofasciculus TaxID=2692782 RepID=UPI001881DF88|nr:MULTISPECIES: hypothetical protein [unclassified Coleofasciculus]MBE9129138.1 hypothetical protein [Coleofasciculus sp. LEGE 07081]MBE9149517.1 hypothetical protein [Coleofasciculus sp. LEGE 07092]